MRSPLLPFPSTPANGLVKILPAMLPAGSIVGALYHNLQTQTSSPEDGRNYRPKHVELIVTITKLCYCCIKLAVYIIVKNMFCA
jgi:hypothetical protein